MNRQYTPENAVNELLSFIDRSPSAFHTVHTAASLLDKAGYTPLFEGDAWELVPGGRYYVTRNLSSIIAFRMPLGTPTGFSIAASHSDFPSFKIKEQGEILSGEFTRLNTEKYGGMICSTWLDRPLSVAGRVVYEEGGALKTALVNIDRDLLLIPNVAIHMNRNLNDGFKFNPAVDTVPLFGGNGAKGKFLSMIAENAGVEKERILGTDLFLYPRVPGSIWGADNEYVSSRSLDDLQCAFSTLKGLLLSDGNPQNTENGTVPVCAILDNEEVGSQSKQGAASTFLYDLLRRIAGEKSEEDFRRMLSSSFLLSCDNAHGVHPNHPEYADGQNRVSLNGGIVIKFNAAQRYTTDAVSEAVVKYLCRKADVPVQFYANRSDIGGGSTLGGIATTRVSINSADIGLAQLAMHSCYETAGVKDTAYLVALGRNLLLLSAHSGRRRLLSARLGPALRLL